MKKYKLIKEYPESETKGTIFVSQNDIDAVFKSTKSDAVVYWDTIGKYSEYFEEIKEEPNYLITAFIGKDNAIRKIKSNGMYSVDKCITEWFLSSFTEDEIDSLIDGGQRIYSVKNSKGEEFTIGDKIDTNHNKNGVIKSFTLLKEKILIVFDDKTSYLDFVTKSKTPIFVSEDGKEFYADFINIENEPILFSVLPKAKWQETRYRLNDCIKFPKKEWLHFHTKEARQEYIDNNKPKYSWLDIEKILNNSGLLITPFGIESVKCELKKLGK